MSIHERIQEQEHALNSMLKLTEALESAVTSWETHQVQYAELMAYYGSSQWHEDRQAYDEGALDGVACGVLSEDAVYNAYL